MTGLPRPVTFENERGDALVIAVRYSRRMKRKTSPRSAHLYLLRLERVQRQGNSTWLIFLEPVASEKRRAFGSFDALTDFLKMEFGQVDGERNSLPNDEPFPSI